MVNLQQAKLHLRVDQDEEDSLIQTYLDAATQSAYHYLNWVEPPPELPAPVVAAILLEVAELYVNREKTIDSRWMPNRTYMQLLNPYRIMDI